MHPVPARSSWHPLAFPRDPFLRDVADTASGLRRSGFCLPDFGAFSSWNQTRAYRPWNAAPPRSRLLRTVNRPSAGGCTVGQPAGGSTRRWGDGRGTGFPRWSNVAPRSVCMQLSGNRRAGAPSVVEHSRTRAYRWGQWPCTLAGTRHTAHRNEVDLEDSRASTSRTNTAPAKQVVTGH